MSPDMERGEEPPRDEEDAPAVGARRPSVYDDAMDGCHIALWTYLCVDLRDLADQGKLNGDQEDIDQILGRPLQLHVSTLLKVFSSNVENLETYSKYLGPDKDQIIFAIQDWAGRHKKASSSSKREAVIVRLDDDYKDSEFVYMIAVSHAEKRVVVSFRGSVSEKDWRMNMKAALAEIPNPVHDETTEVQLETVGIHDGFQGE